MAGKKFLLSRAVFLGALLVSLCGTSLMGTERTIQKNFDVKPGGTLHVQAARGSITVTAAEGNNVGVVVTLTSRRGNKDKVFDEFDIRFDQRDDDVEIVAKDRSGWLNRMGIGRRLRVHFEITVPKNYSLDLQTAGGDIRISDLIGEVQCRTSGGDIELGDIDGAVQASTSGGDISLHASTGVVKLKTSGGDIDIGSVGNRLDARTSGGTIRIDRARGDVSAKTSGGSITVDDVMGTIDARASGGSIRANITQQLQHDSRLVTSGGDIVVRLVPGLNLALDAKTSGGSVKTDVPITVQGKLDRGRVVGKVGTGGPLLYLKTSGGSIHIVSD